MAGGQLAFLADGWLRNRPAGRGPFGVNAFGRFGDICEDLLPGGRPEHRRCHVCDTLVDEAAARAGVDIIISVETNAARVQKQLVAAGHGCGERVAGASAESWPG
jgi:hypothetical protein